MSLKVTTVMRLFTLTFILSCPQPSPQQTTAVATTWIVRTRMIQERKEQSERGHQVSLLYFALTSMAFPTESEYNDSKGLMILATLHTQLPPVKPGDKQQSNAKQPVINKVVYIHENTTFINTPPHKK